MAREFLSYHGCCLFLRIKRNSLFATRNLLRQGIPQHFALTRNKDRSSYKYVVNADYWLKYVLEQFASEENYNSISNAYKYIMKQLIFHYGEPDLEYSSISDYREFIYFNNINEIFSMKKDEGILLIKMIYDSLSDLLRLEQNFKHQRAK